MRLTKLRQLIERKKLNHPWAVSRLFSFLLLVFSLPVLVFSGQAQDRASLASRARTRTTESRQAQKLAGDLREEVALLTARRQTSRLTQMRSFIIQTEGAVNAEQLNRLQAAGARIEGTALSTQRKVIAAIRKALDIAKKNGSANGDK